MEPRIVYENLLTRYGPQHWWPVHGTTARQGFDPTCEILVGCILTQNTAWRNVEKAIDAMYAANCLDVPSLRAVDDDALRKMIRPAGYFNQKARKLRHLVDHIEHTFSLSQRFINAVTRNELLSLWGIGPETADSMLLYAGNRAEFVIDAYTKRLCASYGIVFSAYDEYKQFFTAALPCDTQLFNEFHALIVAWGKDGGKGFAP